MSRGSGDAVTRLELEASLEKSRRVLPIQAAAAIVLLAATWASQRWLALPGWLACVAVVLASWGVVGDALNIVWCRCKLRRLKSGSDSRR